jgi:hypothetical protein
MADISQVSNLILEYKKRDRLAAVSPKSDQMYRSCGRERRARSAFRVTVQLSYDFAETRRTAIIHAVPEFIWRMSDKRRKSREI